jgi:hypothetical protein
MLFYGYIQLGDVRKVDGRYLAQVLFDREILMASYTAERDFKPARYPEGAVVASIDVLRFVVDP